MIPIKQQAIISIRHCSHSFFNFKYIFIFLINSYLRKSIYLHYSQEDKVLREEKKMFLKNLRRNIMPTKLQLNINLHVNKSSNVLDYIKASEYVIQ